MTDPPLHIRTATVADVPLILSFIRELAEVEKLSHTVVATEGLLRDSVFGAAPAAEVVLAFVGDDPVGFALYFHNYSTFLAQRGLYLEDLYVRPNARGRGVGRRLLAHLAGLAVERGCGRLEWSVLDWNKGAIRFYRSLGACPMDEWTVFRLSGESVQRLASGKYRPPSRGVSSEGNIWTKSTFRSLTTALTRSPSFSTRSCSHQRSARSVRR